MIFLFKIFFFQFKNITYKLTYPLKYCSHCSSPDIVFRIPKDDTFKRWVCSKCGKVFYDNPRVIVGCLVTSGEKILLCKRAIKPQYGLWNLPAGFLENGESAEDGAMRETFEESKARVEIVKLHVLYSLPSVNQVYLHFLARHKESIIEPTKESLEVRFFDREEIPWDQIAFHSTTFALEKYFESGDGFEGIHIGNFQKKGAW